MKALLVVFCVLLLPGMGHAADFQSRVTAVTRKARPAVVSVQVMKSPNLVPELQELLIQFGVKRKPRLYRLSAASGSGVVISPEGRVLTNHHVVQGSQEIYLEMMDKRRLSAHVVGMDPRTDLAILQIDTPGKYAHLKLGDSSKLKVGNVVLAIGNPFEFDSSVTMGVVSAKGRRGIGTGEIQDFIQTDAAVNPGNSGGPLVDLAGNIVGINTAIFARGGEHNLGISFAIPSNMAFRVMNDLESIGRVRRSRIGVLTKTVHEVPGFPDRGGAEVTWVIPFGPAEKAGVRRGDVFVSVNGEMIDTAESLRDMILARGIGERVQCELARAQQPVTLPVRVVSSDSVGLGPETERAAGMNWAGLYLVQADEESRVEAGAANYSGVMVRSVKERSVATQMGLMAGDWILEVGGRRVSSIVELSGVLADQGDGFSPVRIRRATGELLLILPTGARAMPN